MKILITKKIDGRQRVLPIPADFAARGGKADGWKVVKQRGEIARSANPDR